MSQAHATLEGRPDERISAAVRGLIAQRRAAPAQVAMTAGMSRAALYRKLSNASPWQADEVERLARFFDVSVTSLFEGRAEFALNTSTLGSEGWEFESLRVHPQTPRRGRRRSDSRRLSLVPPIYADVNVA